MKVKSYLALTALAVATFALQARGGTLAIPAWSFARGNARVCADPAKYADAGPVVIPGPEEPWGWRVEYDIDLPVDGSYTLSICYASAESRPVQVFCDNRNLAKTCNGISLTPASSEKPSRPTWKSSGARWEVLRNRFGRPIGPSSAGKHTIILTRRGPLPHLVALRLDTEAPFPADWQPPRYKVRDFDRVPAKYHKAFTRPGDVDVAAARQPVKAAPEPKPAASLQFPAWTFDRGNARIYASPDLYADAGPVVGGAPRHATGPRDEPGAGNQPPAETAVEYDIDFPVDAECTLHVSYASAEARPVEVRFDGKFMGMCCIGVTYGSAPKEQPIVFTSNSSGAPKRWEGLGKQGKLVRIPVTKGKHTLRFSRRGPLPNLIALRLGLSAGFPKGWKPPQRKMRHLDRVPVRDRAVFLPVDAVNLGALRAAIQDTIKAFGPRYPGGKQYLERLAAFEKRERALLALPGMRGSRTARTWASEAGKPEAERTIESELAALRREAMLAHPALGFDKLLFLKRKPEGGHIYEGHQQKNEMMGSSLCVLSPVSPDGKVTDIAPQLAGGLFSRFDLSFDARKVVFGYRTKDTSFHIYELDIDPSTGLGVEGSLRRLSCVDDAGKDVVRDHLHKGGSRCVFHDTDPVYLPDGRIMFVSTRCKQSVFCFPATVTSLYVMDADGRNIRRLSSGPLTEMGPCVLDDGRIAYTRWEYVDKGLGNGQGLWMVRPDGSFVDHLYKNSITRPSGMLSPRSIPGSPRFVTVGCSHMSRAGGPVILVDTGITKRSTEAMTCITPEIGYPCMYTARWAMGYFLDPYAFSEKFFLVSHIPGDDAKNARYGIYALDAWGSRAKLYGDPEISCFQPTPLLPRRRPAEIVSAEPGGAEEGTMFIQDVYEGMTGIERGRVKYVRVMGVLPWPWNENGMFRIGLSGNVHRKRVYGVAKVHEDGSAFFKVPAGENIFFQALDEDFMLVQHMPTFINVMAGENRSCIGCHEHRTKAPATARARPLAMKHPAQALAPQPGDAGPRMVDYAADVQPVLDTHCVGCHGGSNPKARLDLTGVPTASWNRSYESILGRGLVGARDCSFGRSGYRPAPPLTFGSGVSRLTGRIRNAPCKAKITRAEFVRIVTWIDANTPYYGTYRGKRDLKDKDHPDFRALPLVHK